MKTRICLGAALAVSGLLSAAPARAQLIINATFQDAQFAADGFSAADITNIHSAFNAAAAELQGLFADSIHINIEVTSGNVGLGQSSTNLVGFLNYADVRQALQDDITTADDATAFANMAGTDPTGSNKFILAKAQAKALGLMPDDLTLDGTFTFSKDVAYTFDPLNRAVPGKFDFIGLAHHEITEIMGRIGTLGSFLDAYMINDLYRYTGVGAHSILPTDTGAYLSIDNGITKLAGFNSIPGGDLLDYDGALATDPFNAFTGSNQGHVLSSAGIINMDIIGYDRIKLTASAPEPSSLAFVGLGVLGMAGLRRRRRT